MKKILSAVLACAATMSLATCAFAEDAPATAPGATDEPTTPGASDEKPIEFKKELTVGTAGIEGDALNAELLVQDGKKYTWAEVDVVTFESEGLFSVQFSTTPELCGIEGCSWFTMGKDEVPAAKAEEEDKMWANSWSINEDVIKLFDTSKNDGGYVKVAAKEDGTVVKASVTMKKDAKGTDVKGDDSNISGDDNQNTGIALAVAPAGLAVAFVAVAAVMSKKKKG